MKAELTPDQMRVLRFLAEHRERITPTALGGGLGIEYRRAARSVTPKLTALRAKGLVKRVASSVVPTYVTYQITEDGRKFLEEDDA